MNKKKTILTVTIYLLCLVAVIGVFVFYNANQTEKSKTRCYITTTDIEAGTLIDTNVLAVSFKQDEVHQSYKDTITSYGANLIVDASSIVNKQTAGFIPAGSIITDKMFVSMKDEIVYDGISNPQYITLPVSTDALPAEGFTPGQRVSVIGLMSLADLSQTELVENATETWVGILTNKAEVFGVITDETEMVTNVILVVEKDVYATLLISAGMANLYYLNGEVDNISEVQSDIIKSIYQSTGLTTTQDFEIMVNDNSFDNKYKDYKLNIEKDEDAEISNLQILQLGESNSIDLSWTGSPVNAFIKHYSLDGSKGKNYGSYSYAATDSSKKIYYDSNSEEHSLAISLDSGAKSGEGYYEIKFYNKDNEFIGKTNFVIEGTPRQWIKTGAGVKVSLTTYDETALVNNVKQTVTFVTPDKYSIDFKLTKDYFSNIGALMDYKETITFNENAEKLNANQYIIDTSHSIAKLFGLDIYNIVLREQKDGYVPVDVNIFQRVEYEEIDYDVTTAQLDKLRNYLGSNLDNNTLKQKLNFSDGETGYTISYSSMEQLLNVLESLQEQELLYNETTLKRTTISYFLRFLITGEDMTYLIKTSDDTIIHGEYMEIHNLLFKTDSENEDKPILNETNYYKLGIVFAEGDNPFSGSNNALTLDITFIPTFEIVPETNSTNNDTGTEGGTE